MIIPRTSIKYTCITRIPAHNVNVCKYSVQCAYVCGVCTCVAPTHKHRHAQASHVHTHISTLHTVLARVHVACTSIPISDQGKGARVRHLESTIGDQLLLKVLRQRHVLHTKKKKKRKKKKWDENKKLSILVTNTLVFTLQVFHYARPVYLIHTNTLIKAFTLQPFNAITTHHKPNL